MTSSLFLSHFWGDKHNGWDILYTNMKNAETQATNDMLFFIREFTANEEQYSRGLMKLHRNLQSIKSSGNSGCFTPCWDIFLTAMDSLSGMHMDLISSWQSLAKEIQKYSDEQAKDNKAFKDSEHYTKTLPEVTAIKFNSTEVQRKRQMCLNRQSESRKVKANENASQKEVSKVTAKLENAVKEYKFAIEKYNNARNSFEKSMSKSCIYFEEVETRHLETLRDFIKRFASSFSMASQRIFEIFTAIDSSLDAKSTDILLQMFVHEKASGTELPPSLDAQADSDRFLDLTGTDTDSLKNLYMCNSIQSIDTVSGAAPVRRPLSQHDTQEFASNSNLNEKSNDDSKKSKTSLFGGRFTSGKSGRKKSTNKESTNPVSPDPEPWQLSGSDPIGTSGIVNQKVDSEGYIIVEDSNPWGKRRTSRGSNSSSSSDSSDEDVKIKVHINTEAKKPVANEKEISEAVKSFSPVPIFRPQSRSGVNDLLSMDFDPISSNSSIASTSVNRPPSRLRPRPKTPDSSLRGPPLPVVSSQSLVSNHHITSPAHHGVDPIPVAVGLTECVHTKWNGDSCLTKAQGCLSLAFPAASLPLVLKAPTLMFRLKDTDLISQVKEAKENMVKDYEV